MYMLKPYTSASADAAANSCLLQPGYSQLEVANAVVDLGNILRGPCRTLVVAPGIWHGLFGAVQELLIHNLEADVEGYVSITLGCIDVLQATG
jgi:hypothetical protein